MINTSGGTSPSHSGPGVHTATSIPWAKDVHVTSCAEDGEERTSAADVSSHAGHDHREDPLTSEVLVRPASFSISTGAAPEWPRLSASARPAVPSAAVSNITGDSGKQYKEAPE